MNESNWKAVLDELQAGTSRAAIKTDGQWTPNIAVKQAILDAFKKGQLVQDGNFVDKDSILPQQFTVEKKVRIVPGGTSIRRGSYIAPNVIIMPPSYINIGVYIDCGTMIDSHVLVGSCAQIGKNVHLSAGVKIGGVLEPIGLVPVVIEDNAFIGAGVIIVEGIQVSQNAIIAPGVVLSRGVPVYDCINETILEVGAPIPPNAVVVPGTRKAKSTTPWMELYGLNLNCALIVKYRDNKTNEAIKMEDLLR